MIFCKSQPVAAGVSAGIVSFLNVICYFILRGFGVRLKHDVLQWENINGSVIQVSSFSFPFSFSLQQHVVPQACRNWLGEWLLWSLWSFNR